MILVLIVDSLYSNRDRHMYSHTYTYTSVFQYGIHGVHARQKHLTDGLRGFLRVQKSNEIPEQ